MNPAYWTRHCAEGVAIVDLLLRARAAYDRAAALNARHRERDAGGEASAYAETVAAVAELGRVTARLRLIMEDKG